METAALIGAEIAKTGAGLTYGGGKLGLMGVVADAALEAGGNILGVIPKFLTKNLLLDEERSTQIIVNDLSQRKAALIEHSDAFVVLPGGIGTLDEVIEVIAWRQLNQLNKPIGLLNVNSYFNPLLELFKHMITEGFLDKNTVDTLVIETGPKTLVESLIWLITENENHNSF